jgi:pSer/pThr/pTyr-binding forkhead associated (FHA) protein
VRERQSTRVGAVFTPPAPGRPAAFLVNTTGRHPGKPYPIEKTSVRIGAEDDNDLVVPDDGYVSRRHAAIRFEGGTLYLTDLQSSNGTWRNEVRLGEGPVSLAPGDVLRFARTTYEVRSADYQAPRDDPVRRENHYERRVP